MASNTKIVSTAQFSIAVTEGRVDTINNIYYDIDLNPIPLTGLTIDETSEEIKEKSKETSEEAE